MTNKIPRTRREELIEKYSEYVVEQMDLGELMLYAQEQIAMGMIDLSDEELLEDISQSFDDKDEASYLYKFPSHDRGCPPLLRIISEICRSTYFSAI